MKIPFNPCSKTSEQLLTLKKRMRRHNKTKKYNKPNSETSKYIKELVEEQKTKASVIPLNIYQVWHDKTELPKSVKESIEKLKEQNPEFTHQLFDEKECREFIETHYSRRILDAYDSIVPHAIKADLWRYCYMYKNGGIYLDIKYYGINGFKLILLTDKEYFCKDIVRSLGGIYNAILICKPKNKIMLKCIQQTVKNVEKKYYGPSPLCPTGPLMMKNFFTEKQKKDFELTHEYINDTNRFIDLHHHRVLKYHENYRNEKAQQTDHYTLYWKNKTMYQ
jgi:mannosyltransferase OCH1-like enzyme